MAEVSNEEEDDKAAALEALLEQFREPEEPRKKANPLWIILALMLAVAGCWLAMKVTEGTMMLSKITAAPQTMKPAKVADRSLAKNSPKFSVETYVERCRRGMTPQQVRWIVGDFQKAGLDDMRVEKVWQLVHDFQEAAGSEKGPGWMDPDMPKLAKSEAMEIGWQQRTWYLDALADGLSLDVWQRRQAKERCGVHLLETEVEFMKKQPEGELHPISEAEAPPYAALVNPSHWLKNEEMAPWRLVDLTDAQLRITWHDWIMSRRDGSTGSTAYDSDYPWFDSGITAMLNPLAAESPQIGDFSTGDAPSKIDGAGSILPYTYGQDFSNPGNLKSEVMACHPAQLKILLLLKPDLAATLMDDLEASGD
ncbi:hypothetical protein [Luteolibacter sp. Populi]|uniref:hypothetical protein n=1 Tax=Luteolibacter sp. Populi TaxID=3230487 RepID=UPI003466615B